MSERQMAAKFIDLIDTINLFKPFDLKKFVSNRAVTYHQPAILQTSLTRLSYGQGWQLQMPELAKREITFMVGP